MPFESMTPAEIAAHIAAALFGATFLSLIGERITQGLIVPAFNYQNRNDTPGGPETWPRIIIMYISWVISGVVVYAGNVNLVDLFIPNPQIGQALTAIVAGGGSNFVHEIFDTLRTGQIRNVAQAAQAAEAAAMPGLAQKATEGQ